MDSDYFSVHLGDMKAKLQFCELESDVQIGETVVSYTFLNLPGLAIGFRICSNGQSLVYLSDHEPYGRLVPEGDVPQ